GRRLRPSPGEFERRGHRVRQRLPERRRGRRMRTASAVRGAGGRGGRVDLTRTVVPRERDTRVLVDARMSRARDDMPSPLRLVTVLLLAVWSAGARDWQVGAPIVSSPMPAPIVKRGLTVQIRDLVRLPDTRGLRPLDQDVTPAGWARINFVRDLPDGRRF